MLHIFDLLGGTFGGTEEKRVGMERLTIGIQQIIGQKTAGTAHGHVLQLWLPLGQQVVNTVGNGNVDTVIDPIAALHQLNSFFRRGELFLVLLQDIRFHGGKSHGMYRSLHFITATPSRRLEGVAFPR